VNSSGTICIRCCIVVTGVAPSGPQHPDWDDACDVCGQTGRSVLGYEELWSGAGHAASPTSGGAVLREVSGQSVRWLSSVSRETSEISILRK
jgi:hypothetical protein